MSALLAFMSVSGILGWLNIGGGDLAVDQPGEVYSGLETLVTVRLVNRRRLLPLFLVKAKLLEGEVDFDMVDCAGEEKRSFLCTFRERGEQVVTDGELSSPFPINFFVRSRRIPVVCRFLVFPFPLRSEMPGSRDRAGMLGDTMVSAKGYEGDVAKITDYSGADPLRLIHWRLSAKFGELKVKELTATAQTPVIIDVESLPGRDLEENLSRAAYLVNNMIRSNRPVGMKLGELKIEAAVSGNHRMRLLSELARYGKH